MTDSLVSVIIPALNEAENIRACIAAARRDYPTDAVEIIVVDGGSTDGTPDLLPANVTLIHAPRGRAVQMNRGAAAAHGEVLLFCHADSRLPAGWREAVIDILSDPDVSGGVFRTQILPETTWLMWLRNRQPMSDRWWEKHGDQAQFMLRATFERLGGFPDLPLMEDVEMSRALHQAGRYVRLPLCVTTSSRRYLEHGVLRQAVRNRWNLFRYLCLGATAEEIARTYRTRREGEP